MDTSQLNEVKAALDLYLAQYNATDKLWAYFSTVTLAVLGFSIGSDKVSKSFLESSVVVIGYVVFCFGNSQALMLAQEQLVQFADLARQVAGKHDVAMSALIPISVVNAERYYWAVVVAVCAGILLITTRRQRRVQGTGRSDLPSPKD